ncbi:MAG TPA: PPK2 family polyphosphate kinase [Cytophagales bacterium]|nr:PPK2 family polyphosphate kinase [Cytophagales bacterium]
MKIDINKISTRAPKDFEKEKTKKLTKEYLERLPELQNRLFAQGKFCYLIVIQGVDASGKDGVVKAVFTGVNPSGCSVASWKAPTELEKKHDFLWRIHQQVPEKGMIKIFNRSHYEDVLVTRVERWIDNKEASKRFKQINDFESLISEANNTIILKFYLHISREEQLERLEERIKDPIKNWKYNPEDMLVNNKWDAYMDTYNDVFENCNKIPWIIVPSDQNWYKEYLVAKTLVESLESLKMTYPKITKK